MDNFALYHTIILVILIGGINAAKQASQKTESRDRPVRARSAKAPPLAPPPVRGARYRHRNRERQRELLRQSPEKNERFPETWDDIDNAHGKAADIEGSAAKIQGSTSKIQGSTSKSQGSAADHEPLYGFGPPVFEVPKNPSVSGSKSHLPIENDPHELPYSDQYIPVNANENTKIRAEFLGNIGEIQSSAEEKDSFSQPVTDLNWSDDFDLDITTEGQINVKSRGVDSSMEFQNQGRWNDPEFLKDLVMDLQEQLRESKTSQRVTRSVLNTLEEKQNAQAMDLQIVKDEVLSIKKEQRNQKEVLATLQEQVSNNAWGARNIKDANAQIRMDLAALKQLQAAQNSTMETLSDLSKSNSMEHTEHSNAIRHLQHDLLDFKAQLEEDKAIIFSLQESLLERKHAENLPDGYAQGNFNRQLHNSIPVVPSLTDDFSRENSGDGSRSQESHNFDELASSIEEKHHVIGDHISRIIAREERMEQDLARIRNKFSFYDARIAQLTSVVMNSSMQLAQMEKSLLANENQHTQNGVTSLQEMASQLMNFTNQIMHLQSWHLSAKGSVNTTWSNQQHLQELQTTMDNLSTRVQGLEYNTKDHRTNAKEDIYDLQKRVDHMETTVLRQKAKVSDLQVRLLNRSLESCEKDSKSLKHELKIEELDRGLSKVENRLDTSDEKITKMERGISKLFEMSVKQGHSLGRVVNTVSDVGRILPSVGELQKDMLNLLAQLPADCSELLLIDRAPQNGVYLVHARGSATSVRLACDFNDNNAWTVIQKRSDGNISFARTWKEYKYGFGDPETEFWIGNENLHFLTSQDNYQLQIEMTDLHDSHWWARYDVFRVSDEESMYSLDIDGYRGNATDAFRYSNGMPFSTSDVDNDVSSTNCAKFYTAGWWYKHCHYANLNGRYTVGIVWFDHNLDEWVQMKETVMKIRPLKT